MIESDAEILIIDDDQFVADCAADILTDRGGYRVQKACSADEALELLSASKFRLIIVDVKMPPGKHFADIRTARDGYKTGILLAREIRRRQPEAAIIIYTGTWDPEAETWFSGDEQVTFLYKSADPNALLKAVQYVFNGTRALRPFIVHGHDPAAVEQLRALLRDEVGFGEPIVLWQEPSFGMTVIEKFEHYAAAADVVFVLMTPDDMGGLATSDSKRPRSRQNVISELGYFWGVLRRRSGRVFVLHRGPLELPTDLSGVILIDIDQGIEAAADIIKEQTAHLTRRG